MYLDAIIIIFFSLLVKISFSLIREVSEMPGNIIYKLHMNHGVINLLQLLCSVKTKFVYSIQLLQFVIMAIHFDNTRTYYKTI